MLSTQPRPCGGRVHTPALTRLGTASRPQSSRINPEPPRQMYGRAGFQLLRHRILRQWPHPPLPPKERQSRKPCSPQSPVPVASVRNRGHAADRGPGRRPFHLAATGPRGLDQPVPSGSLNMQLNGQNPILERRKVRPSKMRCFDAGPCMRFGERGTGDARAVCKLASRDVGHRWMPLSRQPCSWQPPALDRSRRSGTAWRGLGFAGDGGVGE
jgi:hypothetical protein